MRRRSWAIVGLVAFLCASHTIAQPLAPHAIAVIVPYPAGSAGDILARTVTHVVGDHTGRSFVIDNKPGASMAIVMRAGAQARADGATFIFTSMAAMALLPAMKRSLPYDPVHGYEPVALTLVSPLHLAVRKDRGSRR